LFCEFHNQNAPVLKRFLASKIILGLVPPSFATVSAVEINKGCNLPLSFAAQLAGAFWLAVSPWRCGRQATSDPSSRGIFTPAENRSDQRGLSPLDSPPWLPLRLVFTLRALSEMRKGRREFTTEYRRSAGRRLLNRAALVQGTRTSFQVSLEVESYGPGRDWVPAT